MRSGLLTAPGRGLIIGRLVSNGSYRGKRIFDLTFLALGSPIWAFGLTVCAIGVRVTSGPPVLFKQERVGRDGKPFQMLKLRTMRNSPGGNAVFPNDAAITSAGRLLRRSSLDELPQLLNVAVGDMSPVGPRPVLPYQAARLTPNQRRRNCVRPGLTGLAQLRGRNQIPWSQRIEHDLEYLEIQSPRVDLNLLWRTISVAFRGEGIGGHPIDDPIAAPNDQPHPGA